MTDRGRTTHVPARGKTRKKPGSIFHRPPPHRPLLAGAETSNKSELLSLHRCESGDIAHAKTGPENASDLSGPISRDIAIVSLRYPLSRDTFSAIPAIPQQGAIPPFGAFSYTDVSVRYPNLQHIARCLCDTPGKHARKKFAILSVTIAESIARYEKYRCWAS